MSEFGSKVKGSGSFKVGPENALAFLDVGFDVKGLQALINEFGDGILSPGEFSTYLNQVRHSSAGPTFAKEYPEKFNALVAELRKADAEVRNNISELGQENLAKCFDAVFSDKEFQKLLSKKSLVEPSLLGGSPTAATRAEEVILGIGLGIAVIGAAAVVLGVICVIAGVIPTPVSWAEIIGGIVLIVLGAIAVGVGLIIAAVAWSLLMGFIHIDSLSKDAAR